MSVFRAIPLIARGPRACTQFDLIIIIRSHQFKTYLLYTAQIVVSQTLAETLKILWCIGWTENEKVSQQAMG